MFEFMVFIIVIIILVLLNRPRKASESGESQSIEDKKIPLHDAVRAGDLEEVKKLIEQGADIHARDNNGCTALHSAAVKGHMEVVKYLVDQGVDIHAKDNSGWTPLYESLVNGHLDIVNYFMGQNADINITDNKGIPPIFWLAAEGKTDMIDYLVSQSTNSVLKNIWAVSSGNTLKIFRHLVEQGVDIHAKDNSGWTALHSAAANGQLKAVKYLVEQGADIHARANNGATPLHSAAANGQPEAVKCLVEQGADIHARANNGATVSDVTDSTEIKAYLNNPPRVKVRIVQAESRQAKTADTELHEMVKAGNLEVVKYLLSKGVNCNTRDAEGKLPLQLARESTHEKRNSIIVALIKAGAEE